MKGILTILLLTLSNCFMTLAWYGHLQFKKIPALSHTGIAGIILISWLIALLEYIFMVPANRIGFNENGGPFNLFQLKLIQEIISIIVFAIFAVLIFKTDKLQWNYIAGFACIILAVIFVFKKW